MGVRTPSLKGLPEVTMKCATGRAMTEGTNEDWWVIDFQSKYQASMPLGDGSSYKVVRSICVGKSASFWVQRNTKPGDHPKGY
jgi:hypothetical protein